MDPKLKVALLMRGAISKQSAAFLKMNDIYNNNSNYVDYVKCYNSIVKHILEPNSANYDFHIFCQCWNTDLEHEINNLYKPRKALFEDNRLYNTIISDLCKNPSDFSGISQTLAMKKAIELKELYEIANNINYDIVILYRYDVLLWKDIILNSYDLSDEKIFVNGDAKYRGDFHFIMKNSVSDTFKGLFSSLGGENVFRHHFWIQKCITQIFKKKLIMDTILPGKHQEVIRKIYKFSINKGYLSKKQYEDFAGIEPTPTYCLTNGCPYLIHTNIENNDGKHCCKMCKETNTHGNLCEKRSENS